MKIKYAALGFLLGAGAAVVVCIVLAVLYAVLHLYLAGHAYVTADKIVTAVMNTLLGCTLVGLPIGGGMIGYYKARKKLDNVHGNTGHV